MSIFKTYRLEIFLLAIAGLLVLSFLVVWIVRVPREVPEDLKSIVPLEKIVSGGPPKDGIPSIDNPKFVESSEAFFLSADDSVIGVEYNGVAKAYPLLILVWHEIVNDMFVDTPLVITYCPLCYSSLTFVRVLNGSTVEFGTSGRLYKNDLVMYDRQPGNNQLTFFGSDLTNAGNLWSQMLGQAIVGDRAGQKLTRIPTDVMEWKDWMRLHPETLVLSKDTGFSRSYGVDPYGGYYRSSGTLFPVENRDDRLDLKEIIFGVEYDEKYKAYPIRIISERMVLNDVFRNRGIAFFKVGDLAVRAFESDVNGQRLTFEFKDGQFIDRETKSIWNEHGQAVDGPLRGTIMNRGRGHKAFWFAWADFHPETEVFE